MSLEKLRDLVVLNRKKTVEKMSLSLNLTTQTCTESKANGVKMNDINNLGQGKIGVSVSSLKIVETLMNKIIELTNVTI